MPAPTETTAERIKLPQRVVIAKMLFERYAPDHLLDWGSTDAHGEYFSVADDILAALAPTPAPEPVGMEAFQARVDKWLIACFGETIARDRIERNHRFIEEALELVQANGCTQSETHQLVDYVYGRPAGELHQEVGGVMNTLAALCLASGVDLNEAAETELARVWTKVEKIRAKQAAKPKHSPLPEANFRQPSAAAPRVEVPDGWQNIASAPYDCLCDFWLEWADDMLDRSRPIPERERQFRGMRRCWSSIYKATYWRPLPPATTQGEGE